MLLHILCTWMNGRRIYYIKINIFCTCFVPENSYIILMKALQLENILFTLSWTQNHCKSWINIYSHGLNKYKVRPGSFPSQWKKGCSTVSRVGCVLQRKLEPKICQPYPHRNLSALTDFFGCWKFSFILAVKCFLWSVLKCFMRFVIWHV